MGNEETTTRRGEGMTRDPLTEYRSRRDFTRTGEPAGGESASSKDALPDERRHARPLFVIQKHDASSLHYDLRLELDGVLKSWTVPKGPSLDPREKRLAVMTEDHPLEYAAFEGVIPEGEYGAGTVMVWDMGWWEPDATWDKRSPHEGGAREAASEAERPPSPSASLSRGELKFILHGVKLSGSWVLVQMKGRGLKNWLLIKHRDDSAEETIDITTVAPDSVATGRSLEEIAAGARTATGPSGTGGVNGGASPSGPS